MLSLIRPDALQRHRVLIACGLFLMAGCLAVAVLSDRFAPGRPPQPRPYALTAAVFAGLFVVYLSAAAAVSRTDRPRGALFFVIVCSLLCRVILLFSSPILEVDAWRYLWDGRVVLSGGNPWAFSPQDVLEARRGDDSLPPALKHLTTVRDRSPAMRTILSRVHFRELTTVYPPVSQAVFALAAAVTPVEWPAFGHLIMLKAVLAVFDMGVVLGVAGLLKLCRRPPALCLLYGWCPLVLKEFANTGHLDAIAVFLVTLTALCALKAFIPSPKEQGRSVWLWATVFFLTLAVGAKIYPVILFPLLFVSFWRTRGAWPAVAVVSLVLLLSGGLLIPMLWRHHPMLRQNETEASAAHTDSEPPRPDDPAVDSADRSRRSNARLSMDTGLAAFATQWQMNDFLFMLLYENLRPDRAFPEPVVWFVVTPNSWRIRFQDTVHSWTGLPKSRVPFLVTRFATMSVWLAVAWWLAIRPAGALNWNHFDEHTMFAARRKWLETLFLTTAWFWLLLPTQNPWYWTWAMPFVPFSRSRSWRVVSGLALIYYARFRLAAVDPHIRIGGSLYDGKDFFDFWVTWLEFGPLLLWLAGEAVLRIFRRIPESAVRSKPPDSAPSVGTAAYGEPSGGPAER